MRFTLAGYLLALGFTTVSASAEDRWLLIGRVGIFAPRAAQSDDLLYERTGAFGLDKKDWRGPLGGAEVAVKGHLFELGQHVDAQQAVVEVAGGAPDGTTSLFQETVGFGLTVRLVPDRRFAPYLLAGPDLLVWRYEETAVSGERKANGTSVGFHAGAGLRFFVSHSVALSLEYRRQFGGADMKGDFAGKHLDLTGDMATLGLAYRF